MDKIRILSVFIVFFLVTSSSVCANGGQEGSEEPKSYSDMDRVEKQDFIEENLGTGFNPDNVDVSADGKSFTIKSGVGKLKTKEGITVNLAGGRVDTTEYSGDITMGAGGTITDKFGTYEFGSGGSVKVVDGVVVSIKQGNLKKGLLGDSIVSGDEINYDSSTETINSKKELA